MEKDDFVYTKLQGMSIEMQTQERRNMVVLRGKALLNEVEQRLMFVQNAKRGARSVEVWRCAHSRMVRRPDGKYTLTVRFAHDEKYVREKLIAEVREMVNRAGADGERESKGKGKGKRGGGV